MTNYFRILRSLIVACVLSTVLFGCATVGSFEGLQDTYGKSLDERDVMKAFKQGDLRLTCRLSCAGISGVNMVKTKSLHYDHLWVELALLVAKIGYEDDLSYYYLGRSAEGAGYIEAAKIYYRIALNKKTFKCAGFINNCDGFVFPRDIQERLDLMFVKN